VNLISRGHLLDEDKGGWNPVDACFDFLLCFKLGERGEVDNPLKCHLEKLAQSPLWFLLGFSLLLVPWMQWSGSVLEAVDYSLEKRFKAVKKFVEVCLIDIRQQQFLLRPPVE